MFDQPLAAASDPMIGQRIDRYVIRRQLAEGGMGAVYLASHELLENTRKVIKILLPEYARHPLLRDRFEHEARAVSRLHHKHIIQIDNYGQLPDGQLFLMMPFLDGRTLDVYLQEHGKLTEHLALHILAQVCSALQHMHDAGVVHRDIKPSNIFLVEDDDNPYRVVLIDLGIAKSLSDRGRVTHPGATMGTPAYMAIEQYESAGEVTPLADLYAVAIVAWELVTGSLPWGMHSAAVLYTKQQQERPARPPGMSMAWWTTLSEALSVRPADRPQSVRALAIALASAVPAIPPYVPSGGEILAKLTTFVQHAPPGEDTVRNASDRDRIAPIRWPPREDRSPAPVSAGLPPLNVYTLSWVRSPGTTAVHVEAAFGAAQLGRRAAPTTLTASSGGTTAPPVPRIRRLSIVLAVLAGVICSTAGVAVLALGDREATGADRSIARPPSVFPATTVAGHMVDGFAAIPPPAAAPRDASAAEPAAFDTKQDASEPATGPLGSVVKNATASVRPPTSPASAGTTPKASRSGGRRGAMFDPDAAGGDE